MREATFTSGSRPSRCAAIISSAPASIAVQTSSGRRQKSTEFRVVIQPCFFDLMEWDSWMSLDSAEPPCAVGETEDVPIAATITNTITPRAIIPRQPMHPHPAVFTIGYLRLGGRAGKAAPARSTCALLDSMGSQTEPHRSHRNRRSHIA